MSLREQISKAILDQRTKMEIVLHGKRIELGLPSLGRESRSGYNVRKKDQRMKLEADKLADEQMAILATC